MSDKEIGDPNVQYVEEVETSVVTEEVIFHSKFQNVEEAADGSNPSGASGIVVGNPVTTVVIEEASSAPGGSAGGKVVVLPGIVTNTLQTFLQNKRHLIIKDLVSKGSTWYPILLVFLVSRYHYVYSMM